MIAKQKLKMGMNSTAAALDFLKLEAQSIMACGMYSEGCTNSRGHLIQRVSFSIFIFQGPHGEITVSATASEKCGGLNIRF